MTEAVEFEVPPAGEPQLEGQDGSENVSPGAAAAATPLMVVPGWTQDEAARVMGGLIAGVTTALYLVRHHAPPAPELVPAIAGDPVQEFPLMGQGLAPVLDLVAPKGSAAAVGVSLGAGLSEVACALARRVPVLDTPPPQKGRPAATSPAAAAPAATGPAAAPQENGRRFRFNPGELRVLGQSDEPLAGIGLQ